MGNQEEFLLSFFFCSTAERNSAEIRLLQTRADGRSLCLPAHSDAVSIRAIDLLQEAVRCADAPGLKCVDSQKKKKEEFPTQTAPVRFFYANQTGAG